MIAATATTVPRPPPAAVPPPRAAPTAATVLEGRKDRSTPSASAARVTSSSGHTHGATTFWAPRHTSRLCRSVGGGRGAWTGGEGSGGRGHRRHSRLVGCRRGRHGRRNGHRHSYSRRWRRRRRSAHLYDPHPGCYPALHWRPRLVRRLCRDSHRGRHPHHPHRHARKCPFPGRRPRLPPLAPHWRPRRLKPPSTSPPRPSRPRPPPLRVAAALH